MDSMQLNYYGNKLIKKLQIVSQFKCFRDIPRLKRSKDNISSIYIENVNRNRRKL